MLGRCPPCPHAGQGRRRCGGEDGGQGNQAARLDQSVEGQVLVLGQRGLEGQIPDRVEDDQHDPSHPRGQIGPKVLGEGWRSAQGRAPGIALGNVDA